MACASRAAAGLPLQVALHWIRQQDLPPQRGRSVRAPFSHPPPEAHERDALAPQQGSLVAPFADCLLPGRGRCASTSSTRPGAPCSVRALHHQRTIPPPFGAKVGEAATPTWLCWLDPTLHVCVCSTCAAQISSTYSRCSFRSCCSTPTQAIRSTARPPPSCSAIPSATSPPSKVRAPHHHPGLCKVM